MTFSRREFVKQNGKISALLFLPYSSMAILKYNFKSECFFITDELICIEENNKFALLYIFGDNKKSINIYSGIHKIFKTSFCRIFPVSHSILQR